MKIIFENDQLLVVDKPAGLVVNKSETVKELTLQDQLSEYFGLKSNDPGIGDRAGIVHRLDRETSGLLLVAKKKRAFEKLQEQFKNREVKKKYIALVHGSLKENSGEISADISRIGKFGKFGVVKRGKESQTQFSVEARYEFTEDKLRVLVEKSNVSKSRERYLFANAKYYSLVNFYPKTGRTHQIRVHAKYIGNPVVSDAIYDPAKLLKFDLLWCSRLFLHAAEINFKDPRSGKILNIESQLPVDLKNALRHLTPFL